MSLHGPSTRTLRTVEAFLWTATVSALGVIVGRNRPDWCTFALSVASGLMPLAAAAARVARHRAGLELEGDR